MSAAPHEIGAPAPALAVVPHPAPAPSLAQLVSHRAAALQGQVQGRPQVLPQAPWRPHPQRGPLPSPGAPVGALREPTFDELVTGYGRHRGQQAQVPGSLLRRLALRARLLPTPARRPAARATGDR
jgi:hypothetical protein